MQVQTMLTLLCALYGGFQDTQKPTGVVYFDEINQELLSTIVDGPEALGEGFSRLVKHVDNNQAIRGLRQPVSLEDIEEEPSGYRGQMFGIEGSVELVEPLTTPWEGVQELFIRRDGGQLLGLYVVGDGRFQRNQRVQAPALFYKTMRIKGRDSQVRVYPMFVTTKAFVQPISAVASMPKVFYLLLAVLLTVFVLFFFTKRGKNEMRSTRRPMIQTQKVVDALEVSSTTLPNEPSEALARLFEDAQKD